MKYDLRTLLVCSALGLASTGLASPGFAQEPDVQRPPTAKATASAQTWIQQLGSDSYRKRLEAERKLRELGEQAVPLLKKAAAQEEDGEVQWRAKRLLRQIARGSGPDEAGQGGLVERPRRNDQEPEAEPRRRVRRAPWFGGRNEEIRQHFDRLFRDFERDFGIDIPRRRFFSDDFFRDLEAQMKALESGAEMQGMNVQIGPDGVRVEVQEKGADGKVENKVYEAPDLKTFKKQYPDVLRDSGLGLNPFDMPDADRLRGLLRAPTRGFDWQVGPRVLPLDPRARRDLPMLELDRGAAPPAGKRLGVTIRDLPDALREYLDLDAGTGLMVESVQEDTLAKDLGLEAGDIVTHINKTKIGSPADVQRALGAITKGEAVAVDYIRRGSRRIAEANKRASAAPAVRQPLEKRAKKTSGSVR